MLARPTVRAVSTAPLIALLLAAPLVLLFAGCRKAEPSAEPTPVAVAPAGPPAAFVTLRYRADRGRDQAIDVIRRRIDALRQQSLLGEALDVVVRPAEDDEIVVQVALPAGSPCESSDLEQSSDLVARSSTRAGDLAFYRLAEPDAAQLLGRLSTVPALEGKVQRADPGKVVVKGMDLQAVRAAVIDVPPVAGSKLVVGPTGGRPPIRDEAAVYAVVETPVLLGSTIREASVMTDEMGRPDVMVTFSDEAAEVFGKVTAETVGQPLPIVFEGSVLMAPQVREPITGGRARITLGGEARNQLEEAREVAAVLNAGALTQTLQLIERTTTCP